MLVLAIGITALCVLSICVSAFLFLKLSRQQKQFEEKIERKLQQLDALNKRLDNYLTGSIHMGEQLHQLQQQVAPLPERLQQIEHRDPSTISFTEAARLVGLGATSENLQQACGLSQAEAELLIRMQKK